jgi:hypothetical protein
LGEWKSSLRLPNLVSTRFLGDGDDQKKIFSDLEVDFGIIEFVK